MDIKPKTYTFDFDGVIADYNGFKGHEHIGEPIEATVGVIRALRGRDIRS